MQQSVATSPRLAGAPDNREHGEGEAGERRDDGLGRADRECGVSGLRNQRKWQR